MKTKAKGRARRKNAALFEDATAAAEAADRAAENLNRDAVAAAEKALGLKPRKGRPGRP